MPAPSVDAGGRPPSGVAHLQFFSSTEGSEVRWRLLSRNNREIARSIPGFASVEECFRAVQDLRSQLHAAESAVRRTSSNEWIWELSHAGAPSAVSGRQFDRMIRCQQGLSSFLLWMGDADVGPRVMVSSDRRWGDSPIVPGSGRGLGRTGPPRRGDVAVRPSFTGIPPR